MQKSGEKICPLASHSLIEQFLLGLCKLQADCKWQRCPMNKISIAWTNIGSYYYFLLRVCWTCASGVVRVRPGWPRTGAWNLNELRFAQYFTHNICLLLFHISFLVLFDLIPSARAKSGFQNSRRFTIVPQWDNPIMDDWQSTSPLNTVWMMKNQE